MTEPTGTGGRERRPGSCGAVAVLLVPVVAACATLPPASIPAAPAGESPFVAFDIDGTLTPHNLLVSEARPDAAEVVRAFAASGYEIVYITTRVPGLQTSLPVWLDRNGFPPGNLHVAQSAEDRANAADFKLRVLDAYLEKGWRLAYAFGDSPTDFVAYQRAGLPKERVFALKRKWHGSCEDGVYGTCLDGWTGYLRVLEIEP